MNRRNRRGRPEPRLPAHRSINPSPLKQPEHQDPTRLPPKPLRVPHVVLAASQTRSHTCLSTARSPGSVMPSTCLCTPTCLPCLLPPQRLCGPRSYCPTRVFPASTPSPSLAKVSFCPVSLLPTIYCPSVSLLPPLLSYPPPSLSSPHLAPRNSPP